MAEPFSDAQAWVERLREVNRTSNFTASEREWVERRLAELHRELKVGVPFVEGK